MSLHVAGIGELLWDILPGGRKLGGAPANFSYHAAALGASARVISRVGSDEAGQAALNQLRSLSLSTECVEIDPELPTGAVTVSLSPAGQPEYTIHENAAWDALRGELASEKAAARADALCFGTLGQRSARSRATIRRLVSLAPRSCLRILDVNLRPPYDTPAIMEESLALANVLKINEAELPRLAVLFRLSGDARGQIRALAGRFDLDCVAFTRGAEGSLLFARGEWSDHAAIETEIADTVGAGDAFTAAVALGLRAEWPLALVHRRASELAAYVCSQSGATPQLPQDLRAPFLEHFSDTNLSRDQSKQTIVQNV